MGYLIVANAFESLASFSHGVWMYCWNAPLFHLPNICTWESDIPASFAKLAASIQKLCVVTAAIQTSFAEDC